MGCGECFKGAFPVRRQFCFKRSLPSRLLAAATCGTAFLAVVAHLQLLEGGLPWGARHISYTLTERIQFESIASGLAFAEGPFARYLYALRFAGRKQAGPLALPDCTQPKARRTPSVIASVFGSHSDRDRSGQARVESPSHFQRDSLAGRTFLHWPNCTASSCLPVPLETDGITFQMDLHSAQSSTSRPKSLPKQLARQRDRDTSPQFQTRRLSSSKSPRSERIGHLR